MILLDTHVLLFDALVPQRLSKKARQAVEQGFASGTLACSDISLWEIAMLVARGRVNVEQDALQFIDDVLKARCVTVLPITSRIAVLSQSDELMQGDPADRLIAATALAHKATLVSADTWLRKLKMIDVVW